jgi:L-alanine-DL-glutamate epimerase-like enolase superfamily enzyme
MINIDLQAFDLPLKHVFKIAHDERSTQRTLILTLTDGNWIGYGEATENPYYQVTYEAMRDLLEKLKVHLIDYQFTTPEDFWNFAKPHLASMPFAQCALDQAANDLYGRAIGKPLYEIWNLNPNQIPLTNYTIGIASIDEMVAKMKEVKWKIYKIKLGTNHDLDIIRTLRSHTDAVFRVDANCAWTAQQTVEYSHELKKLGVEFIEQPLKADDWAGMKEVFLHSALPIIADESCIIESDVAHCQGYFHGINIKLTKCGGLTPARRMIANAKNLGLKTMVGCMTESSIGISAIAHLAPMLDYVDMDGAMLLKEDIADGVKITENGVIFPTTNGIGATLKKK